VNSKTTFVAGSLHGSSARQTGLVGDLVATP
jgi:hypothetical protein